MNELPEQALRDVAAFFQVLAEPTRLKILNLLREQERNVGDLALLTGHSAPNVSRHLTQLAQQGLVVRESRGASVYCRIADPSVYELCELVCGSISRRHEKTAAGASWLGGRFNGAG